MTGRDGEPTIVSSQEETRNKKEKSSGGDQSGMEPCLHLWEPQSTSKLVWQDWARRYGWQFRAWSVADAEDELQDDDADNYKDWLDLYAALAEVSAQHHILRLVILERYGGLLISSTLKPNEMWGRFATDHLSRFKQPVYIVNAESRWYECVWTPPHHVLWHRLFDEARQRHKQGKHWWYTYIWEPSAESRELQLAGGRGFVTSSSAWRPTHGHDAIILPIRDVYLTDHRTRTPVVCGWGRPRGWLGWTTMALGAVVVLAWCYLAVIVVRSYRSSAGY